jgi:hypothetical protein
MDQLALFAPEVAAPQSAPPVRLSKYARVEALIACPAVEADLMEVFRELPTEWLNWSAFRSVIAMHAAGFGLGHKLGSMAGRGLIEDKRIFLGRGIGADQAGSPDYHGFKVEYRLAPASPERTTV